ncbi:MAG: DUF58 domain-containing protein [Candidatus Dormiibacterota bacterium]
MAASLTDEAAAALTAEPVPMVDEPTAAPAEPAPPTRRRTRLLIALRRVMLGIGIAALLFFAYVTAVRLAYALLYAVLLLLLVSWVWTRFGIRRLALEREAPSGAYEAGERFTEHLVVTNDSLLGLPWIEVFDQAGIPGYNAGRVLNLGAKRSRRWRSDGTFMARGTYSMGPLTLATGDPFGIFRASRTVPSSGKVVVYPRLVDATPIVGRHSGATGETVPVGQQVDTPPEAFGIREYYPDDGVNRIHWPSTARLGRPMSKSFEKYEGNDMMIALDLDRGRHYGSGDDSSVERAVSLAASIAMVGAERGQAVGLICSDAARTNIRPGRGAPHQTVLLEALALADADGIDGFDRVLEQALSVRGNHTLFVITPEGRDERWIDRLAGASPGNVRSTIIRLRPGAYPQGSRRPRRVTDRAVWWDISTGDEIFVTSSRGRAPAAAEAPA